jgi:4-methyl-5(b-hydroxyethyl)-thiazole monophosphate biosynthesis
MSKVLVPLATGFEEIEAVNIIDILRRAQIEVLVATLNDDFLVKGANGITLQAQYKITQISANDIDMCVLPGGYDGTMNLAKDENVQNLLKELDTLNKNIGAICAAPYALHTAGVLKQNYTCYPSFEEKIRLYGFQGDKSMVVEDGNVMTSRGPATALCFALAIVKKLKGEEIYTNVKNGLLATYCD